MMRRPPKSMLNSIQPAAHHRIIDDNRQPMPLAMRLTFPNRPPAFRAECSVRARNSQTPILLTLLCPSLRTVLMLIASML